jgi:hypothetical protein
VQLVGEDALPDSERVLLEIGRILREDYLRQSAFDDIDAYSSLKKQSAMLSTILYFADAANGAVKRGVNVSAISKMKTRADISRMKGIKDGEIEGSAKKLRGEIDHEFAKLVKESEGGAGEVAAVPAKEKEAVKVNDNVEDMKEAKKVVHDAKKATKHHAKPKTKGKRK